MTVYPNNVKHLNIVDRGNLVNTIFGAFYPNQIIDNESIYKYTDELRKNNFVLNCNNTIIDAKLIEYSIHNIEDLHQIYLWHCNLYLESYQEFIDKIKKDIPIIPFAKNINIGKITGIDTAEKSKQFQQDIKNKTTKQTIALYIFLK